MRSLRQLNSALIRAMFGIAVLFIVVLGLGAIFLLSRGSAAHQRVSRTRSSIVAPTQTSEGSTSVGGAGGGASEDAATPTPLWPVLGGQPVATTEGNAPAGTAAQSATTVAPSAPTQTARPALPTRATAMPASSPTSVISTTASVSTALDWPDFLPSGMTFASTDSWPFRTIAPDRQDEPFLIFRGGTRWLLIRNARGAPVPLPRSVRLETIAVGSKPATLVNYLGGGFTLVLQREGRTVHVSGDGLSVDDLIRVAASLRTLSSQALRARLIEEAAKQEHHVTLLWPSVLPGGVQLVLPETAVQLAQPSNGPHADSYHVVFQDADKRIEIGGGTTEPPKFSGTKEIVASGSLTATLTVTDRRFLLVINGPQAARATLTFPTSPRGQVEGLPLVQQGRVFIAAQNVDRPQFDAIVSNLQALSVQTFVGRARGQDLGNITYTWPSKLPHGYTIDTRTVKVAFDDYILQGGLPFFEMTANGPHGALTIQGGRESNGDPFVVPEGGDVQRVTATIQGQTASAAQTNTGAVVVWTEDSTLYSISTPSLPIDQLVSVGQSLQPISAEEFFRRIAGPGYR